MSLAVTRTARLYRCWSGCGPIHLDDGAGAVVVFERTPAGWSQTRELIGRGDMWYREFGTTMAMHAGLVVAGAPNRSVASAMRLEPGSSDGGYRLDAGISYGGGERYGSSVAVDGDWIAVGAGNDDEAGNTAGAVYVYRRIEEFTPFCCKSIGAPFCTSAQQPVLSIDGSERTVDDCLLLHASLLPGNAVGVFLMGARENRVELPGHASALCLAGAGLLRLHPEVLSSGGDEVLSKTAGTRSIPGLASGIVPGSTWAFQAWYRKGMVKGFTNGVEVTFR